MCSRHEGPQRFSSKKKSKWILPGRWRCLQGFKHSRFTLIWLLCAFWLFKPWESECDPQEVTGHLFYTWTHWAHPVTGVPGGQLRPPGKQSRPPNVFKWPSRTTRTLLLYRQYVTSNLNQQGSQMFESNWWIYVGIANRHNLPHEAPLYRNHM